MPAPVASNGEGSGDRRRFKLFAFSPLRARNAEPKFINTTTYRNKQGDVLCASCTGDHYRRRLLTTTVQMRNVRLVS